jgi:dTMP kinase
MIDRDLNKKFISFEGIDFSGKSTQIALLKDYFEKKGEKVYLLREPGGTEISERIRTILLDKKNSKMHARTEMLLFNAARAQLTFEKIIPLLKDNKVILADRFFDSTTAYQGYGRQLELDLVHHVNDFATYGLYPGLTFYLKINPGEAFKRRIANGMAQDRLESSGQEFYDKVCAGYEEIAKSNPERFIIIDASQVKEAIHRHIINSINLFFKVE